MADTDDFKSMILAFRVSDLQLLLGFAGRNKSGRKEQLQIRALELLKLRSAPIQMKIKELHRQHPSAPKPEPMQPTNIVRRHSPRNPPQVPPVSMKSLAYYRSSNSSSTGSSNNSSSNNSSSNITGNGTSNGSASGHGHNHSHNHSHSHAAPVSRSTVSHHSVPLDYSSKYGIVSPTYPVHPDVKFRKLPFYQVLAELLKPASLVPSGSSRFQEANFAFHLTPQQAQDIAISRDLRPGAKMEYTTQVQMRFCLLETSCEQDDNFPPSICVKVNSKMCPLPNPIPTNKPGVEPKRPSRPVNITFLCKLSPTVTNLVNVSWASEYGRGYAVAVYLVRRLTSANLIHKLKAAGIRNADHTRALIKEKLAHDADSEIATTSLRVSLMCPLGKMRMQIPCRAITCTHLQCFDASLYIQMNEKKPTWMCPVCDKLAPFDALVIDGLFMEIFRATSDCNEIQFHDNGSWSPMHPKKEMHMLASPVESNSSSSGSSKTSASAACSSASGATSKIMAPKFEVVDLTLDSSSDDDCEPPCKLPTMSLPLHTISSAGHPMSTVTSLQGTNSEHISSAIGSSLSNRSDLGRNMSPTPAFRDMPMLDSSSSSSSQPQLYYPPVSSSYADFLQSTTASSLFNYHNYGLFNLLGQSELDRQFNLSSIQSSGSMSLSSSHRAATSSSSGIAPSSPDVISLD